MTKPALPAATDALDPSHDPFFDDPFIAEILADPETRAAFEDELARTSLIDSLVKLRQSMKLTQTQVARRMGVKQPMVSGFETEGSDPRLSTIQRFARALEATVTFRLTVPAHCDWIPRSDGYEAVSSTPIAPVTTEAPSPLATDWVKSKRREFAPAA